MEFHHLRLHHQHHHHHHHPPQKSYRKREDWVIGLSGHITSIPDSANNLSETSLHDFPTITWTSNNYKLDMVIVIFGFLARLRKTRIRESYHLEQRQIIVSLLNHFRTLLQTTKTNALNLLFNFCLVRASSFTPPVLRCGVSFLRRFNPWTEIKYVKTN